MEPSQPQNQEDHIAGKGLTSMTHYNFGAQVYSYAQAMKIQDARAAVDKEWKNI